MQTSFLSLSYKISINDNTFLTGSISETIVIIVSLAIICLVILFYIWQHFREDNRLKYEFITIVAHKFRTPLTSIKWICDEMISGEQDQFKKKNLENIQTSNQKLIDLTGTLIEVVDNESSNSTYTYKKILLCDLVKNVLNNFKDSFHEKNIFVGFHCDNEKIMAKADQTRLEFVISTLLENACIYTPVGKNVDITIYSSLFKTYIAIEDNGIGIPRQDLPHIFTKFFRSQNAKNTDTEGFGIGLYLASSIIRHFHGKIRVESPGENLGSRFTVILPRTR